MYLLNHAWDFTRQAWYSLQHTVATVRWAPKIYSREGMRYMRIATWYMLFANAVELLGPYFIGQLVAAHAGHDVPQFNQMLGALCAVWIGGTIIERRGSNRREIGWNLNDRASYVNLSIEWWKKTPGEIADEDRTVGANQIESGSNSLFNLQFAVFFTGVSIVATVAVLTIFLIWTDVRAGLAIAGVLVANLIVIFYVNHWIHLEAKEIDRDMRAIKNQLIEYWKNHSYVVGTGNEHTVLDWLTVAMEKPWQRDYQLWGFWYAIIDGARSVFTAIALAWIIYVNAASWDTATLTAILGWLLVYREQFWMIADTQREIAKNIEKIHALREDFEIDARFNQGAFNKERRTHAHTV